MLAEETGGERRTVGPARVEIGMGKGARAVERIHLPDSLAGDIALLRLAEPVTVAAPVRLGHPALVRIGDQVWAPDGQTLHRGIVDRFESFPEQNLHLFKTGLEVPPSCSGSPLFNDLGEVVGILTIRERKTTSEGTFALSVDALRALLSGDALG